MNKENSSSIFFFSSCEMPVVSYISKIILGQQDLSDGLVELAEEVVIQTHEPALTNSSDSLCMIYEERVSPEQTNTHILERLVQHTARERSYLDFGKVFWLGCEVESSQSDADGTAGDEDDSVALLLEFEDGLDDERESGEQGEVGDLVADRRRAQLDDDSQATIARGLCFAAL